MPNTRRSWSRRDPQKNCKNRWASYHDLPIGFFIDYGIANTDMDAVDGGGGGESSALAGAGMDSASLFQGIVELPQICRCDLGKLLLPRIGLDVVFHRRT